MSYRNRILLDGEWSFWTDPEGNLGPDQLDQENSRIITVPAPWQSQGADLLTYTGAAWYARTVDIPGEWFNGCALVLGVGAADYRAEAWLNGIKIGEHSGGYLPFEFEITRAAKPGNNTLVIRVDDPVEQFSEVPHGKQGWYGPLSGLWQSVWLECRSYLHARTLEIISDLADGCVEAVITFSGAATTSYQVLACLKGPEGEPVASTRVPLPFRNNTARVSLRVPEARDWSPEEPNLYTLEIQLQNGVGIVDSLSKQFGFRTIEARDGRLWLNGKPLYLRAALDQDYYPDTICTTPSEELLVDQIRKAKELGLNCLRVHIKVADPRYYEAADRLGMLVWSELPNWSTLTAPASERGRETYRGILARDGHHPSIIIWTIINEDWGTDLVNNPDHRAWLRDTFHWLKALDPSRLVVDNSPCTPNFHVESDIEDYHYYRAIPDHRRQWDLFVNNFARRASWTYSPHGDIVRSGKEPLILSEFGNWGLPDPDRLVDAQGKDPWWFETGYEWTEGVVYPHGVRERFRTLGLAAVFGSWEKFIRATQQQEFLALIYQIEAVRKEAAISGYVITELTDVHWECNGLLDLKRNPKAFQEELGKVNAATIIIPEWERTAYWAGDEVRINLTVAHGEGCTLEGARARWGLAGTSLRGELEVMALNAGDARMAGEARFLIPPVEMPRRMRLELELVSASGKRLAENWLDLAVFPRRLVEMSLPTIFTPDRRLGERLYSLGYPLAPSLDASLVAIAAHADPMLLRWAQEGGRLLLLADRAPEGALMPGYRSACREGTAWAGDWASSFTWVKRGGALAGLPGDPLIDHSFDGVIPDRVITGFKDWEFPQLVHAGMVVGWVHKPAVIIGERPYGRGRVVFNAFRLDDSALDHDPVATFLMDALINIADRTPR